MLTTKLIELSMFITEWGRSEQMVMYACFITFSSCTYGYMLTKRRLHQYILHFLINLVFEPGALHTHVQNMLRVHVHATVNQLVEMFNFLIDNVYIRIGSAVYQQTIGIPMGTDCAPLVADLFFFSYEYEFMHTYHSNPLSVLTSL